MIKEIRCQVVDVENFQKFTYKEMKYIKVPAPERPYKTETLVERVSYDRGEQAYQKYVTTAYRDFCPNVYNISLKRYEELSEETDCIIYPQEDE